MSPADRARRVLRRLVAASAAERILISSAALGLSILLGAVLVLIAGRMTTCTASDAVYYFGTGFCYDPVLVFDRLFLGALGEPFSGGWSPSPRDGLLSRMPSSA